MRTFKATFAALLIALLVPPASAQRTAPTLSLESAGQIQIAVDGSVSDYKPSTVLAAPIASLIDRSVHLWRFEPIMVEGIPVVASTAVHIELRAEPIANSDELKLRIVAVHFGDAVRMDHTVAPEYPYSALQAGLEARVMLYLSLDESGKVVKAEPYQTSLAARARSEREAEEWRKRFERASVAAAVKWRYNLSEKVNGKTIGTSAFAPIEFSMSRGKDPGRWKAYVPGPIHTGSWTAQVVKPGNGSLSAVSDSETLAVDTRFRLKDDVVGKTL